MRINKNPLDEKYREIWATEKNLEIGLEFDEITKGSEKKLGGFVKNGIYQQVIRNKSNGYIARIVVVIKFTF